MPCVSGHPTDLLDRHLQAARERGADAVVKIPSDCPLIDPGAIDSVLTVFLAAPERFDYVGNLHPPTWPDGNDVEVVPVAALETAWREADRPFEREHTTPFLWERPERFRLASVVWESGLDFSRSYRLTVDYQEDYHLAELRTIGAADTRLPAWGSDQAASVEIGGFLRLVANIRDIEKSLGDGVKRIADGELAQLAKLRRVKAEPAVAAT